MKQWKQVWLILLFLCIYIGQGSASDCDKRAGEDLRLMRRNMIANEIAGLEADDVYNSARTYIDTLQEDGSWADVDYVTVPSTTFPAQAHIDRLRIIARAYALPGQLLFESEEAMAAIEKALPAMESKVLKMTGGERQTPGNWWWWNLYIPPKLGFVLAVAEGNIDEEVYAVSLETLHWCLAHPLDWYMKGLTGQATNSIDAIKGNLYYAMLAGREEDIHYIMSEFEKTMTIVQRPYEGLMEDGSYVAHNMIDFYAYYNTFILDSIRILDYVKDTDFMPGEEVMDGFSNALCNGASWAMFQGYRELSASGRSMHGPFTKETSAQIIEGLRFVASQEGTYQMQAQALLDQWESGYEMHTGHRYFYTGDFTIHKTQDSYVSVRTSSSRTIGGEAWGGNGQTNTYMGDGGMWIFNDAERVYDSSFLACMDWDRMPGVTLLKNTLPQRFFSYWMVAEPYVGGVSDGTGGVSAMNLSHISIPLAAQKSWFFFDDEVVCLGSGIQSESEDEALTVIDQREDTGGAVTVNGQINVGEANSQQKLENVQWISNEGVGYFFPDTAEVMLERETREGSWSLLSATQSEEPLHADTTLMYINHGKNVQDGTYAYAVLPNKSADEMERYAAQEQIRILENSRTVQAVQDLSTNSTGIVFWPENREFLSAVLSPNEEYADGICHRNISNTETRAIGVTVKGKSGTASADAAYGAQSFAVSEERLKGDVQMQICWFDDANARSGSYWTVKYLAEDGVRTTQTVPYRYTDEWVTTTLTLEDAAFSGNGLIQDGVELAVVHNGSPVDTTKEKYEIVMDPSMESIAYSTTLYGPIIHSITLSPKGGRRGNRVPCKSSGSGDGHAVYRISPRRGGRGEAVCERAHAAGKNHTFTDRRQLYSAGNRRGNRYPGGIWKNKSYSFH